jgi:hypothetical protein
MISLVPRYIRVGGTKTNNFEGERDPYLKRTKFAYVWFHLHAI